MTLSEQLEEKVFPSNRCEICANLVYQSGGYSCLDGVVPDEEMSGSWDWSSPCQRFECDPMFKEDYANQEPGARSIR